MHLPIPVPGSMVWIRRTRWRVQYARRDRNVVRLDVADRDRRLTFLAPFDRPALAEAAGRPRRVALRQAAARLSGLAARSFGAHVVEAAFGARADILPYQLEPALAVAAGARRLLIADEVGLGKTIQAGLIVSDLKRRWPALRAMVVVPRNIREQWLRELNGRFGLGAIVADRNGLDAAARGTSSGRNPWAAAGVWVTSADYLKQPHVFDAIPPIAWDVVIVDEAHDACGDSARHDALDELARRARHVLLLTATPHVGDAARFERLRTFGQLADVDDDLTTFRRTRASLGVGSTRRVRWIGITPTAAERAVLDALQAFERAVLRDPSPRRGEGALLLLALFRKRALSTMASLLVSVSRRLDWISGRTDGVIDWIQPRLQLDDVDDERADDDCGALTADSGLDAGLERRWLRRIRTLTLAACRDDSKVRRLARLIGRTREPAVVFTEFRHSLETIQRRLERSRASHRRVTVMHGGQSAAERTAALEAFRRGDATVLLATDVVSQGLNLQDWARWVVCVELPWTPARIEQRVGRVDRIGQSRQVHATLIVARHTAENGLIRGLARRALAIRRTMGEDALAGLATLTERRIAETLLAGSALDDTPVAVELTPTRRWQRRARAVGRVLGRRRALARRWRGAEDVHGRPRLAHLRRCRPPAVVLVVSVPVVDGAGVLIERRVLCLALPAGAARATAAVARSVELRSWVRQRLARRLERLRAAAADRAAMRIPVEEAIAKHLLAAACPGEVQPGLFDGRDVVGPGAHRDEAAAVDRERRIRVHEWRSSAAPDLGAISVELVLLASGDGRFDRR